VMCQTGGGSEATFAERETTLHNTRSWQVRLQADLIDARSI